MDADKVRWNEKFSQRREELLPPEPFIVDHLSEFQQGTVLDIACGDGRQSLFLSEKGWDVTGVDLSDVGLSRLEGFAKQKGLTVKTHQMDLDQPDHLKELGAFDNVVLCYFYPIKEFWQILPSLLKEGGRAFICTFNTQHAEKTGFKKEFCLEEGELIKACSGLELLTYKSFNTETSNTDAYIFEKQTKKETL